MVRITGKQSDTPSEVLLVTELLPPHLTTDSPGCIYQRKVLTVKANIAGFIHSYKVHTPSGKTLYLRGIFRIAWHQTTVRTSKDV